MDQSGIAGDAMAKLVGAKAAVGPHVERAADCLLDFLQGLGSTWLMPTASAAFRSAP
jgi:hypothetical protein